MQDKQIEPDSSNNHYEPPFTSSSTTSSRLDYTKYRHKKNKSVYPSDATPERRNLYFEKCNTARK